MVLDPQSSARAAQNIGSIFAGRGLMLIRRATLSSGDMRDVLKKFLRRSFRVICLLAVECHASAGCLFRLSGWRKKARPQWQ